MSMSWGNKLLIVFIAFAALIGTLVYKAVNTRFDLVTNDYYKDELHYQDQIDGIQNANALSDVTIFQDESTISVALPKEMKGKSVEGTAWFYCKTDAQRDRKFPLHLNEEAQQLIEKNKLLKNVYTLKLQWKADNKNYYIEKIVTVN
jgi:hypothetical protein